MRSSFDHPPADLKFWCDLARPLLAGQPTPFYLFSVTPIQAALAELDKHFGRLPVRHWLSCKTQPLRPLFRWWREQGRPVEVVSEFEFLAARAERFPAESILVNGPAKHRWLPRHAVPKLRVNFDSPNEAAELADLARAQNWIVGLRLHTREEHDPAHPELPTQFGMTADEALLVLRLMHRIRVNFQTVHFHLRTNVASADVYAHALAEVADLCRSAGFAPRFVDCGGGFPPPHVLTRDGKPVDTAFSLREMVKVYADALKAIPSVEEIWLENGRWLTARSGVLVVKILEVKERGGMRYLICDGGRTNHALVSNWEQHALIPLVPRGGFKMPTTVTGPTCMAFDQPARCDLPMSLKAGDYLLWLDAGAYHLPWETRFSHGLAAVLWHDGKAVEVVRAREAFGDWWGRWQ